MNNHAWNARNCLICAVLGLSAFAGCDAADDSATFDAGSTPVVGGAASPSGMSPSGPGPAAGATAGSASAGGSGTAGGSASGVATTGAGGGAGMGSSAGTARTDGGATVGWSAGMSGGGMGTAADGGAGTSLDGSTGITGGGTAGGMANGSCPGLPAVTDYGVTGPFGEVMTQNVDAGSEGCTLFRPGASLGMNGFKHPIAVWGNGITTTPTQYRNLLSLFASHGIVTIACNSTNPERPCLNACMDWLVQQNGSGPMAGKLDTDKEFTIGYSWGGGAAIDTATRPNVKATVSFHGMPPRQTPWAQMKAPLLLFTSTGDTFVSASGYVTPNYNSSRVPTFYATLNESVSHTYIIDRSGGAAKEKGPAIAFLLHFGCGVEGAKKMFFGSDCTLCKAPWTAQKKPAEFWQ